jgi:hypothetical protein
MIKTVTLTLLTAATFSIFSSVNEFQHSLPTPVQLKEDSKLTEVRVALKLLNAPSDKLEQLAKSCFSAGFATDIDPVLIASIIPKESEFNIKAKSKLGYKSLMQTKHAKMDWNYAESNVMEGACDLRSKLKATNGDLFKAMSYYKGHGGEESQRFAKSQLEFYRKIKQKTKEEMKG